MTFTLSIVNLFFPIFVCLLTIYNYYTFVVAFCLIFLENSQWTKKITYLVCYHVLFVLFVWSLCQTMFATHPQIPEEYKLRQSEHERLQTYQQNQVDSILKRVAELRQLDLNNRTELGKIRYCNRCYQIKPDRTHHCSTCKKCIIKMDHHCPWVGNCIGFVNHKFFILTLFYATMTNLLYLGTMVEFCIVIWTAAAYDIHRLLICIGFLFNIFILLLVAILFLFHLGLVSRNETTLENMQDIYFTNPNYTFDLGICNNYFEVFGTNICLWPIPIHTSNGNGYEFPVKVTISN